TIYQQEGDGGKKMRTAILTTIICALILCFCTLPGLAQVTTATVYGTVTDPSQAVLPGVTVTMTLVATGAITSKVTDEKGEFAFTFLTPGTYTVKLELPGFKTSVNSDFQLGA